MEKKRSVVLPRNMVLPFVLITSCFALWGFANDITNPMVKAFSRILMMNNFQGSLVQFAFYGGYFAMAFPAALFIKRFSYKAGILAGLGLCLATMCPSYLNDSYFHVVTSFSGMDIKTSLTSANPYILSMGPRETATRRLNFAQAFNPMGSLLGMLTAKQFILAKLNPASAAERAAMDPGTLRAVTASDLIIIRDPYVFIALVILVVLVVIALAKLPRNEDQDRGIHFMVTVRRLLKHKRYYEGVIAQFFYVGVQIMVWTFILHYAVNELGMSESRAQGYNIVAMVIFVTSRFISTFLLKYVSPGRLLMVLAIGGMATTLGAIFLNGMPGLYSLVAISACMSLMFPTIYGIALEGMGSDAKIGAAGLIMAILGGSVLPPLMGSTIDLGTIAGFSATRASFFLPFLCFIVIAIYGFRAYTLHSHAGSYSPSDNS